MAEIEWELRPSPANNFAWDVGDGYSIPDDSLTFLDADNWEATVRDLLGVFGYEGEVLDGIIDGMTGVVEGLVLTEAPSDVKAAIRVLDNFAALMTAGNGNTGYQLAALQESLIALSATVDGLEHDEVRLTAMVVDGTSITPGLLGGLTGSPNPSTEGYLAAVVNSGDPEIDGVWEGQTTDPGDMGAWLPLVRISDLPAEGIFGANLIDSDGPILGVEQPTEGFFVYVNAEGDGWLKTFDSTEAGGVTVHNDLTGKDADDQHPMSAITGLVAALSGKSDTSHNHDGAYEPSGAVATHAGGSDVHPMTGVTGLVAALAGKSGTGHGHAIGDVASLQSTLDAKASIANTGPGPVFGCRLVATDTDITASGTDIELLINPDTADGDGVTVTRASRVGENVLIQSGANQGIYTVTASGDFDELGPIKRGALVLCEHLTDPDYCYLLIGNFSSNATYDGGAGSEATGFRWINRPEHVVAGSNPATPYVGMIWFSTTTGEGYMWDGSAWKQITNP